MKNILRKIAVIIIAAMIIVPATTFDSHGASTVGVTGGDSVKGGEVFTVTVTFDGEDIGRVVGDITYDTDMLSYISGGSSSGKSSCLFCVACRGCIILCILRGIILSVSICSDRRG